MGVNLRDQIRKEQEDLPLQFVYDAADCRIFYTFETWNDYSQLWTYAVNAINDPKLCVAGSTGFSSTSATSFQAPNPPPTSKSSPAYNVFALLLGTSDNQFIKIVSGDEELDIADPVPKDAQNRISQTCNNHGKGCSVGRCIFPKTSQRSGSANDRNSPLITGVCPSSGASSGSLSGLITKNNEPAEIHADGGHKKENEANSVADAIRKPFY